MTTYYYIKLSNGTPIEISQPFESEELPELIEGWDAVWTEQEWLDYIDSITPEEPITPDTATQVSDFYDMFIDNYEYYRNALIAIVEALGEGDEEVGFDTLNATEAEFVALNGIGSAIQISSILANPAKDAIEFLMTKQAFK